MLSCHFGFTERPNPGVNYRFPEVRFVEADVNDFLTFMYIYSQTALEESSFSEDYEIVIFEYAFDPRISRPKINYRAEDVWFADVFRKCLAQAGLEYVIIAPDRIKIIDKKPAEIK